MHNVVIGLLSLISISTVQATTILSPPYLSNTNFIKVGNLNQSITGKTPFLGSKMLRSGTAYMELMLLAQGQPNTSSAKLRPKKSPAPTSTIAKYKLGGSIVGLNGRLTLNLNGKAIRSLNRNGSFVITSLPQGKPYAVTIANAPAQQNCSITRGVGRMRGANIINLQVNCSNKAYTLGGRVYGLKGSLKLQNNGLDTIQVNGDGTFLFAKPVVSGQRYNVTVAVKSTPQTCTVNKGNGLMGNANINNVVIRCSQKTHKVRGTITGLTSSGLEINRQRVDNIVSPPGGPSFELPEVAHGASSTVVVTKQPEGLTCTVNNGIKEVVNAEVNNVEVKCSPTTYVISGSISGLTGSGLVLQNNGGEDVKLHALAKSFAFKVAPSTHYNIQIAQQPAGLLCSVTQGQGTNVQMDKSDVVIDCKEYLYVTSLANNIAQCVVQHDGKIGHCQSIAGEYNDFNAPSKITIHPNKRYAYFSNSSNVIKCELNAQNGDFKNCAETASGFLSPDGIAINPEGTKAYVTDVEYSFVSMCNVDEKGDFKNCKMLEDDSFLATSSIKLARHGKVAYIVNTKSHTITACKINQEGGFVNCLPAADDFYPYKGTHIPSDIAINSTNTMAYIAHESSDAVAKCNINDDGTLTNCSLNTNLGFVNANGIVLNQTETLAYLTSPTQGLFECKIDRDSGNLFACNNQGGEITSPRGLTAIP